MGGSGGEVVFPYEPLVLMPLMLYILELDVNLNTRYTTCYRRHFVCQVCYMRVQGAYMSTKVEVCSWL